MKITSENLSKVEKAKMKITSENLSKVEKERYERFKEAELKYQILEEADYILDKLNRDVTSHLEDFNKLRIFDDFALLNSQVEFNKFFRIIRRRVGEGRKRFLKK